jgi:hypothetical protein
MICAAAAVGCLPLVEDVRGSTITGTRDFEIVARLTGPVGSDSINPTWEVAVQGTDLGHTVNHNGKTYFLFGDTFNAGGNQGSGGADWRHNVMAWSTDTDPSDGITFDGWLTRPNGTARQAIVPGSEPVTYIPTGAISVGDRIYAWYMHVSNWSTGWTLSHAGLARWGEGDAAFTTVPGFRFENPGGGAYTTNHGATGPGNFGMVAASYRHALEYTNDAHVYLWGTPGGREGGVKLARVLPGQIENLSAYRFFNGVVNGVPQWVESEFDAQTIIPSVPQGGTGVGEMSVMYNEKLRAWTMTSMSGGHGRFHIRYADNPWGPWSAPQTIVAHGDPAVTQPDRWGLYAPYMNPLWVEDDGGTIYFTMSLWEPYDVFLAKATLEMDLRTRWRMTAGNWATDPNWSHGTPTAEHRVAIDNGGIARLTTAERARNVDIGTGSGLGGTLRISAGADLEITDGSLRVGFGQGSQGNAVMTGGSVRTTGGFNHVIIADNGSGAMTMSGGSISTGTFAIGYQPTSAGELDLSGDAVISTTGNRFMLGFLRNSITGARAEGTLRMTGGTINIEQGAGGIADAVIGWDGVGVMEMSGGTMNVGNNFVAAVGAAMGAAPRSEAQITHTGGTINTGAMILGERGISEYSLSGTGEINASLRVRLGWLAGSESVFTQSGGSVNALGLRIGQAGSGVYSMSGGTVTVSSAVEVGALGRLNYDGGTIETPALQLAGGGSMVFGGGGALSITVNTLSVDAANGSYIDLADNEMVVREGSIAAIHALVKTGYAGGNWDGPGIRSSVAAGEAGRALGVAMADGSVVVRYTWAGDATVDGAVTIADLGILAANWQQNGRSWFHGDFNYDGEVNIADLGILAANWQAGVSGSGMDLVEAMAMFDVFDGVVIPEPGSLWLAGLAGLMMRRKRRRRTEFASPS